MRKIKPLSLRTLNEINPFDYPVKEKSLLKKWLTRVGVLAEGDHLPIPRFIFSGVLGKSKLYLIKIPSSGLDLIVKFDKSERSVKEKIALIKLSKLNLPIFFLRHYELASDLLTSEDPLIIFRAADGFGAFIKLEEMLYFKRPASWGRACENIFEEVLHTLKDVHSSETQWTNIQSMAGFFPSLTKARSILRLKNMAKKYSLKIDSALNLLSYPLKNVRIGFIHGDPNFTNILFNVKMSRRQILFLDFANFKEQSPIVLDYARMEIEIWHILIKDMNKVEIELATRCATEFFRTGEFGYVPDCLKQNIGISWLQSLHHHLKNTNTNPIHYRLVLCLWYLTGLNWKWEPTEIYSSQSLRKQTIMTRHFTASCINTLVDMLDENTVKTYVETNIFQVLNLRISIIDTPRTRQDLPIYVLVEIPQGYTIAHSLVDDLDIPIGLGRCLNGGNGLISTTGQSDVEIVRFKNGDSFFVLKFNCDFSDLLQAPGGLLGPSQGFEVYFDLGDDSLPNIMIDLCKAQDDAVTNGRITPLLFASTEKEINKINFKLSAKVINDLDSLWPSIRFSDTNKLRNWRFKISTIKHIGSF